jgi:hypothetical protein
MSASTSRRALRRASSLAAAACVLLANPMSSAMAADAARLGTELTPSGAEKGPNKEGTIPAWTGAEPPAAGWSWGKRRADYWPHKAEKPLFTIDATNVDKYAEQLSPGQVAMIRQTKGYRMDVYPSHRDCGVPDFVADNTRRNVGTAKLAANGWSLEEAILPGYPFPLPANGAEAMWNMKMRYRGVGMEFKSVITAASPRKGGGEWIKAVSEQSNFYPWGAKGSVPFTKLPQVEEYFYFAYNSPAALAGQAVVAVMNAEQPSEAFYYFPGQRRVRRMPTYAYDAPQIGFENQYAVDEPYVFNGPIDRFDWKLVGKKEMLVPYNVLGVYDFDAKFEDIAQADFIDPAHRRYELHRVWIVEGTVKSGMRHLSPRRLVYLDEDSWSPLMAVDYDGQGKIWKLREGFVIPVYETGSCDVSAFVQYNLSEGRYVFDGHAAGTGVDARWLTDAAGDSHMKAGFYTSDNLRAISER